MRRQPLPRYLSFFLGDHVTRMGRNRRARQTHKLNVIAHGFEFRTFPVVRKQYMFVNMREARV